MGHANVHPQLDTPQPQPQPQHIHLITEELSPPIQQMQAYKEQQWQPQPLMIPYFAIRQSPFKNSGRKSWGNFGDNQGSKGSWGELGELADGTQGVEVQAVKQGLWNSVLYDIRILNIILDFLPPGDSLKFQTLNHRLSTLFYFHRLFHLKTTWNFTASTLQSVLQKCPKNFKTCFQKLLNESYQQQSEHSLDLDRLESLFLPEQDIPEQVMRVDKVMRVIGMTGIEYFQGLNSIVIVLLGVFGDQVVYWLVRMLLGKTQGLVGGSGVYVQLMDQIQKQVKEKCPNLYDKFQKLDLGVEYFAMKWLMNLFSTDINRNLVLHLWDLILNFGLPPLKWFTVSIFIHLQPHLHQIQKSDDLNNLLKNNLKQLIKQDMNLAILQTTRVLMSQEIYGRGCSEIIQPWNGVDLGDDWLGAVGKILVDDGGGGGGGVGVGERMGLIQEEAQAEQETSYQTQFSDGDQDKYQENPLNQQQVKFQKEVPLQIVLQQSTSQPSRHPYQAPETTIQLPMQQSPQPLEQQLYLQYGQNQ